MNTLEGTMKTQVLVALLAVAISGCAAVWGGAHNIVSANDNGIVIQYDTALTSSVRTAALAREHCKKMGKTAEPTSAEMPGLLLGIVEETYTCVAPASSSGSR